MKDIKELLCCSEEQVKKEIIKTLKKENIPYVITDYYIFTQISDEIKPLVCVHVDTVNEFLYPVKSDIMEKQGILSLRQNSRSACLGADDRAGIWLALQMITTGTNTAFEYGFFCGEEKGCKGSNIFADNEDLERYSCFIGLDRANKQGVKNIALYDNDNNELNELFIEKGYAVKYGSYADCSCIAGITEKACLNVSIGYQNEHSKAEILVLSDMFDTLQVMQSIIIPQKEYKAEQKFFDWKKWRNKRDVIFDDYDSPVLCEYCFEHAPLYETATGNFCVNCKDINQF